MNNSQINIETKDDDKKKIFAAIIMILILMVCTTGATYAYFTATASANNVITGNAAAVSLIFSEPPMQVAPTVETEYADKPLVPQYAISGSGTNLLQKALTGTSFEEAEAEPNYIPCVDANKNAVCKAYRFKLQNIGTSSLVLKGQIKFEYPEESIFTNLKWKLMDSENSVTVTEEDTGTVATLEWSDFVTDVSLEPEAEKTFWLLVWVEETGEDQTELDKGTFNASIQFINNVDGSGVTSSFVE